MGHEETVQKNSSRQIW